MGVSGKRKPTSAGANVHQVILDSVADGVFTVDLDWRITSFNAAAERITGVKRREALGRQCCDVFRASICESDCALKRTREIGKPVVNRTVYILTADGQRVPISISAAVLKDAKGRVIGGVETFRDLSQVEELRKELEGRYTFSDIVGRSSAMQRLFELLPQVAGSSSTVLIEGESGTGKELVARAIHSLSPRSKRRFVAINCGALPDTLLESELFGYKAGAFTDAKRDKPGRLAVADGGTLLLDEIGDISPAMQTRLLRVLQERVFEPLGAVEPVSVDVRIVAATHQDLEELVRAGRFRDDLYYRVNVVRLRLPPLRERREDIPPLIDRFIARFNRVQNKDVVGVSEGTLAVLMAHDYPGNVRELENIIEHAFVLCRGDLLEPHHLPPALQAVSGSRSRRLKTALTLRELEAIHVADALRRHHGSRAAAARELGINTSTLFRKLRKLGIHDLAASKPRSRPRPAGDALDTKQRSPARRRNRGPT
ncbi:MAG TPA: sigma 54-interacting transcriptional regulator [Phycisphaerae bacterium]|nr:sigma 54-interacting transcriptional regulator [Phycisphaerae bacterium]HNU45054.1 sigma 54-interacting transcriptional regulator [Phycisphaerae bacterium]